MEYEDFLTSLSRKPSATACYAAEINAHKFGKSVREVCADFKAKFGVYL